MEHKLIQGGEQYLPFARSRIKALRATGLQHASQQFEIDGVSVKVRIDGEHEYISLGGNPGKIWVLINVEKFLGARNYGEIESKQATALLLGFAKFGGAATVVHSATGTSQDQIVNSYIDSTVEYDDYLKVAQNFSASHGKVILWSYFTRHFADSISNPSGSVDTPGGHSVSYDKTTAYRSRLFAGVNVITHDRVIAKRCTQTFSSGFPYGDETIDSTTQTGEIVPSNLLPVYNAKGVADYGTNDGFTPAATTYRTFTSAGSLTRANQSTERLASLPALSLTDAPYTHMQVGDVWGLGNPAIQGSDFIRVGNIVYDRRKNNSFTLTDGTRALSLAYDTYVRWKTTTGVITVLELCKQVAGVVTVLGEMNLATIPAVAANSVIATALSRPYNTGSDSGTYGSGTRSGTHYDSPDLVDRTVLTVRVKADEFYTVGSSWK